MHNFIFCFNFPCKAGANPAFFSMFQAMLIFSSNPSYDFPFTAHKITIAMDCLTRESTFSRAETVIKRTNKKNETVFLKQRRGCVCRHGFKLESLHHAKLSFHP